ncbi:hypothetical protein F5887DRAFT_1156629 [Amanita rubescens]|nr:hypothetical protein F5887DRAFT_1156629 [Amanita rubescens]
MPPIFKNKRKRLRALMSSVLPASIMNSLGTAAGTKSLPPLGEEMSVRSWIRLVHMGIRPWDSESVEIWEELNGYRLDKAHHVKEKGTMNEHEYVICEFSSKENGKLELRFDRSAGERKDSDSMSSVPSSTGTASTSATRSSVAQSHIGSSGGSSRSSPRGSLLAKSVSSLKARMTKSSASLEHKTHRLSQSSLPRSSGISLQQHLAADAVTRIESHPKNALLLKTLTLSGDPTQRPNLCDLMVLVDVLYNESDIYSILASQCYWHADTVFATLEMWAQEHDNGTLSTIGDRKWRQASTGSFKIFPVYRRDPNQVQRIWDNFMKGRRLMEEKRAEYEWRSKEEIRKRFSKEQDDRERQLTSQMKKDQEERERRMRKEQEEKEQQLKKDQEERERRLRREQEERERRLRKELKKEQEVNEQRLRSQLRKEQEEKERRMKKEQEEKERRMKEEQEEKERRMKEEQEEKERRMKKEQDEKERRMKKEQDEKERRMKKAQDEKERRMKEEQDELKQQVLDQQRRMELLLRLIGPAPNINVSSPPAASIALPDNHSTGNNGQPRRNVDNTGTIIPTVIRTDFVPFHAGHIRALRSIEYAAPLFATDRLYRKPPNVGSTEGLNVMCCGIHAWFISEHQATGFRLQ